MRFFFIFLTQINMMPIFCCESTISERPKNIGTDKCSVFTKTWSTENQNHKMYYSCRYLSNTGYVVTTAIVYCN